MYFNEQHHVDTNGKWYHSPKINGTELDVIPTSSFAESSFAFPV